MKLRTHRYSDSHYSFQQAEEARGALYQATFASIALFKNRDALGEYEFKYLFKLVVWQLYSKVSGISKDNAKYLIEMAWDSTVEQYGEDAAFVYFHDIWNDILHGAFTLIDDSWLPYEDSNIDDLKQEPLKEFKK